MSSIATFAACALTHLSVSMCESPYTLEWDQSETHCPTLIENNKTVPVKIRWDKNIVRSWPSLIHVWTSFYREYYESDMPRLFVRYEDVLFHTEYVVNRIRECVGAEFKSETFQHLMAPAKTHPYFAKYKPPSGSLSAMIKYGSDNGKRVGSMNAQDRDFVKANLDVAFMKLFQYRTDLE